MKTRSRIIALSANSIWNIVNFRKAVVRKLISDGYRVIVFAPDGYSRDQLKSLGCEFVPLRMSSSGMNPVKDLRLLYQYFSAFMAYKPSVFLAFTAKPNIYGGIVAGFLGVAAVNNITGLGSSFLKGGATRQLVLMLYRFALRNSAAVVFQNKDDRDLFVNCKTVKRDKTFVLPGSGVDVSYFHSRRQIQRPRFKFLLVARLLADKGVYEFLEAAKKMLTEGIEADFCLVGAFDSDNISSISPSVIFEACEVRGIEYHGYSEDVRDYIEQASCVVLPSYREGCPRALLEAAAMGLPVITTDVPGCRDAVDDGITGFLCQPRSAADLELKMRHVVSLPSEVIELMGKAGRKKMEEQFSDHIVVDWYAGAVAELAKCD